ncbi:ABC transporter permease [Roseateles depolymerans]|uniref:Amino acid ABC transporter, permease protein, 3-TM region, His/Glu/Gln/Arg/opine n=1 Tax=Roseateles depolymerans TaxID=76731 RepID=A0A0U3LDY4_9BURK|nr:ABC transporter permease [Roseateles depolymerans]ALV06319.1 Amino acid ABC transporter, permease protein, 3-TM region, His/Glu/Gln/Arg/opine [Roseateles depolymerans]REG19291.1 arginine/ornithine transport system permease protein [Roseateles depolymerans]
MNLDAILENFPRYLEGAQATAELLAISLLIGLVLAIPLAVLRTLPIPWLSRPIWVYTYVFRGTPMLVQLFLIYYGLGQFEWMQQSALWPLFSSAWFCACLTFVLNTCAYTTEIIAGSIRALPYGEIEAAKALGMTRWVMLRRIVLPSALRRSLPAYSNEVIFMLHGTSLASVVTIMDLTGAAREINSTYYIPFEAFITAALFYFSFTLVLVGLFHKAEARWLKPLMPR